MADFTALVDTMEREFTTLRKSEQDTRAVLKDEGHLLRNAGSHSIKAVKESLTAVTVAVAAIPDTLQKILAPSKADKVSSGGEGLSTEDKNENAKWKAEQLGYLKTIADALTGKGGGGEEGGGDPEAGKKEAGGGIFKAIMGFKIGEWIGGLLMKGVRGLGRGLFAAFKGIARFVGRMLFSALRGLGGLFMRAITALFNPARLLSFLSKAIPIAAIIGSLFNGIWEAFNTWMEGGSIGEIIGSFFGGIIEFITFGLIDADTIKEGVVWLFDSINTYLIEPLMAVFGFIGDVFSAIGGFVNDYLFTPIMNAFSYIGELAMGIFETIGGLFSTIGGFVKDNIIDPIFGFFDTYIIQPIKGVFDAISGFFASIFDPIVSFFEDLGIPAIGFTIPLYGRVEFGPWYPFRGEGSDEGSTHVDAEQSVDTLVVENADGSVEETQRMREFSKQVGSHLDENGNVTTDETNLLLSTMEETATTDAQGNTVQGVTATDQMLTFNTETGEAEYLRTIDTRDSSSAFEADISKDVYMAGKLAAESGASPEEVEMAMARKAAYERLNWWYAPAAWSGVDPIALLKEQEGIEGQLDPEKLIAASTQDDVDINTLTMDVRDGANAPQGGNNTAVVNAPSTSVNNTTVQGGRPEVRNNDSSNRTYLMEGVMP